MNEIEEIKSRLDLVELVGQYVQLKKAGANYKGVCPFHQEKTPSLMVSPEKQIWKCFGCGKGGDHYAFIMEAEHLEFGDTLRLLAQKAGVTLQTKTKAEHQSQDRKERLYRVNALVSRIWHKLLLEGDPAPLAYLTRRGLTEETVEKFRLGFAPKNFNLIQAVASYQVTAGDLEKAGRPEKFFDRIIFPIFDVLGNVIGFTGRAIADVQPKYLNSPETPLYNKSRVLYGLNFAKGAIKEKDYVVLVEGQMDVVALHQAGVTQAVASSGTAITETQIQILSKYTQNFLLAFDKDAAGVQATKKVIELLLKNDLNGRVVDFGAYKDAGELFEQNPLFWKEAVATAKESVEWWADQEIAAIGEIRFIEQKKKLLRLLLPVLGLISDQTRLDLSVQKVAVTIGVKPEHIYQALQKTILPVGAATRTATDTSQDRPILTNEEQLLVLLISYPKLAAAKQGEIAEVVWQSQDASRIADGLKKCYTDKTLLNNPTRFQSQLKTQLDGQLGGKIDSWLLWQGEVWPQLDERLADELVGEKLTQVSSRAYERAKENLAVKIKKAQESGDVAGVKQLMQQLSDLTKQGGK